MLVLLRRTLRRPQAVLQLVEYPPRLLLAVYDGQILPAEFIPHQLQVIPHLLLRAHILDLKEDVLRREGRRELAREVSVRAHQRPGVPRRGIDLGRCVHLARELVRLDARIPYLRRRRRRLPLAVEVPRHLGGERPTHEEQSGGALEIRNPERRAHDLLGSHRLLEFPRRGGVLLGEGGAGPLRPRAAFAARGGTGIAAVGGLAVLLGETTFFLFLLGVEIFVVVAVVGCGGAFGRGVGRHGWI